MHTWDGYDEHKLELDRLSKMRPYERRAYTRHQDYINAKYQLSHVLPNKLKQSKYNEDLFISLARKYLKLYAVSSNEEDWEASQEYTALAMYERDDRASLRASIAELQEEIRTRRVAWEKAKRMVELKYNLRRKS